MMTQRKQVHPAAGAAAAAAAPPGQDRALMTAMPAAGLGLAEALRAENAALAALDLPRAAELAEGKIKAADAFAAAHAAASRGGARAEGEVRRAAELLAGQLQTLGTENRRLLERAVTVQSRVIETIAAAAAPRGVQGYSAPGRRGPLAPSAVAGRGVSPLAVATRA